MIVSGAPAAGKSTLAGRLARELHLPLISRDEIKERLMDVLEVPDRAASRRVGAASYAVLYAVARALLDAGAGLVLESNFRRATSREQLGTLAATARAVVVHCQAPRAVLLSRYLDRAPSRHPGHHDADVELATDLDANEFEPPDTGMPTLRVDTADGYRPRLAEIVAFVLRSSEHP